MKKFNKVSISIIILAVAFALGFVGPITALAAAVAPALGAAGSFAVLGNSTVTNTGSTVLYGDLGLYSGTSITGFFGTAENDGPGIFTGYTVHQTDGVAQQAQSDVATAYGLLSGQSCAGNNLSGQDLGGLTLTPGVYCFTSSAQLTGTLILNAQGDPNAVWIFQIGTTLTTASSSSVIFINSGSGAPGCNVFWQVGTSATLGTNTMFVGTIIAYTEAITFNTGATLYGRALSGTTAVTLGTNTITVPTCAVIPVPVAGTCGTAATSYLYTDTAFSGTMCGAGSGVTTPTSPVFPSAGNSVTWTCGGSDGGTSSSTCTATRAVTPITTATLTLVKIIVGGSRVFADFPLTATGPTIITGDSATSAVTNAVVGAGLYTLSETTQTNYTAGLWSCIKNTELAVINSSITLASGDVAICTVQNVAVPFSGGGSGYLPVAPLIDVVKVPSPLALPNGPGLVTYTYTLRNVGTVPITNIAIVDDTCAPLFFLSGDTNSDLKLDVNETWTYNCFTTLSTTHTNTVTATGWANNISAVDIASATVVVGVPVIPPLIHVTKVPSPLVLPIGGGVVTYTYIVTNPGTAPLSDVNIIDDKCTGLPGRVLGHPGDLNNNDLLESNETWTFVCQSNLIETTTNTGTASGQANGLTARDFAIVTVVVAPALPNTGFGPLGESTSWSIMIIAGILILVPVLAIIFLRRRTS